jgi:hypothetical protein
LDLLATTAFWQFCINFVLQLFDPNAILRLSAKIHQRAQASNQETKDCD